MKTNLFLITSSVLFLAGCGESHIQSVKQGVLDFNKTTTVGAALDHWKSCDKSEWSLIENPNKSKSVQFECEHKGVNNYSKKLELEISQFEGGALAALSGDVSYASKLILEKFPNSLSLASYKDNFIFAINTDNTFQISSVTGLIEWSDGTRAKTAIEDPVAYLGGIYKDTLSWDPKTIHPIVITGAISPNKEYSGDSSSVGLGILALHVQSLYLSAKGLDVQQVIVELTTQDALRKNQENNQE